MGSQTANGLKCRAGADVTAMGVVSDVIKVVERVS